MEKMRDDPEYRQLVQKHQKSNPENEFAMISEEKRHVIRTQAMRAIQVVEAKQRGEIIGQQMEAEIRRMLLCHMDMAEIYSPPRVATMAKKLVLRVGWSFDLTICDSDGKEWDFNSAEMRNRAARKVLRDKPIVLIGSPMCGPFGAMININYCRMDPVEVQQRLAYGRKHLRFRAQFYRMQVEHGRYFLHEHPEFATSWQDSCIKDLLRQEGVTKVVGDQCRFGLKVHDGLREGPARKSTRFLKNSPCMAKQLQKRCPNRSGEKKHNHVRFENGRAKKAQEYPDGFCRAMCRGIKEQLEADRAGPSLLITMSNEGTQSLRGAKEEARKLEKKYKTAEEDNIVNLEMAWDDVTGVAFDFERVKTARQEEIDYIHKMTLYKKVPISACVRTTGRQPISVRWIDINKGDSETLTIAHVPWHEK